MLHIEDVLQLKDAEVVRLLVRRHPVTLVPSLLLALAFIVIPFFFLFPLFGLGLPGVGLFIGSALFGIVLALRTFILWDADVFIVTSLRLVDVDQKGIFSRFVTEIPLSGVQDVGWQRAGVIDTVFRIGTLTIKTAATENMKVVRVAHPEHIHELINDVRHATTPQRKNIAPEQRELLRKITQLLEVMPMEALVKIESTIRQEGRNQAVDGFLKNADDSAAS